MFGGRASPIVKKTGAWAFQEVWLRESGVTRYNGAISYGPTLAWQDPPLLGLGGFKGPTVRSGKINLINGDLERAAVVHFNCNFKVLSRDQLSIIR